MMADAVNHMAVRIDFHHVPFGKLSISGRSDDGGDIRFDRGHNTAASQAFLRGNQARGFVHLVKTHSSKKSVAIISPG
jgi:hypothetical protein